MRVVICVATFQRPIVLDALLASLAALAFPPTRAVAPLIIVVDNDPAEMARDLVEV